MGVQGRMNPQTDTKDRQGNDRATAAIDQKRQAQQRAESIRDQVREKIKQHYEGTT